MVDLMLRDENLGYQEENWKARTAAEVRGGKIVGWEIGEGMAQSKVPSRKELRSIQSNICTRRWKRVSESI